MSRTIALVTGASRGIGQAIAKRFAKDGHFVIGTSTRKEGAEYVEDYLKEYGGIGRKLDVRDKEGIEALYEEIESVYGSVQILVNNAGMTQDSLLMRMSEESWHEVVEVNMDSVFYMTRRAVRGMLKAKRGRVINITSVVSQIGNSGQSNYAASKAGVEGFSRALAREIGSRQVTVNCIAPGLIETDMTDHLDDRLVNSMLDAIPIGRLGQPEDVAAIASFLAGDESSYITGAVIPVNGGLYLG